MAAIISGKVDHRQLLEIFVREATELELDRKHYPRVVVNYFEISNFFRYFDIFDILVWMWNFKKVNFWIFDLPENKRTRWNIHQKIVENSEAKILLIEADKELLNKESDIIVINKNHHQW